jgi:hypothetical protein
LGPTKGSLLLSDPFDVHDDETLHVSALFVSSIKEYFFDFGFAILLDKDKKTSAVLFVASFSSYGNTEPILSYNPSSPGVNCQTKFGPSINTTVGGVLYGPSNGPEDCQGNCSIEITASYKPEIGTSDCSLVVLDNMRPNTLTQLS